LFVHARDAHRELVRALPEIGAAAGTPVTMIRDAGTFVRASLHTARGPRDLDVVFERVPDLEQPPPPVEGVTIESLADLRAGKLTCLLSRSEPRDLVDLLFLDRLGYPPERDLALALRKDAGMDPGILAWLLDQFPVEPLPIMLAPLDVGELRVFRRELAERFRRLAVPPAVP
jgi:hypothetical protein